MSKLYLGRDPKTRDPAKLDSDALLTHAVVIGMTGSGKTGFAVDMIEEAAIAGIPVIVVDPKGDLGNLALCWEEPNGYDLEPWVSTEEAQRSGTTLAELAETTAKQQELARRSWNLDEAAAQLARVPVRVYTPGSTAGQTVNVLSVISNLESNGDDELTREAVSSAISAVLALAGIAADPLRTPEHVFLSTLVEKMLGDGLEVSLPALITATTNPPEGLMIGAFSVDEYMKPRERQTLALALNNLIAAPSFKLWGQGDDLDLDEMYGKPGINVFYLAHLDDSSRQFFMTLLLGRIATWMRHQPGSRDLRALLFIDEAYGIAPPVSNPPTKKPLLTLIKQGRAFGLGIVLATQNPSDLDYKALATGIWAVGRLQTEQDRSYIAGALSSAHGGDCRQIDQALASLAKRQFLLAQAGKDLATVEARQTLCYLRGPLTRTDVELLAELNLVEKEAPEPASSSCWEDEEEDDDAPEDGSELSVARDDQFIDTVLNDSCISFGLEASHMLDEKRAELKTALGFVDMLKQVDGATCEEFARRTSQDGDHLALIPAPRFQYLKMVNVAYELYRTIERIEQQVREASTVEEL
jgi:hypothetical protein